MKTVPSVGRLDAVAAVRPAYPGARLVRRARDKAVAWSSYVKGSSVVATASSPVKLGSTVVRSLSRHSLKVLNAVAMTNTAALLSDDSLSVDLDWRPALSATQEIVCWSCGAITACVVYLLTAPAGMSISYATCIGLLFGLVLYTLRNALLEELYKARERIEADLGDPDSRFRHIDNLSVHVKVKAARSLSPPAPTAGAARLTPPPAAAARLQGPVPAVHCYHGFGSNTWSWSLVQQQLAERLGAVVTAHDMPGFGLTQRPTDLSGYYLAFNGRLGRLVMDYELTVRGLLTRAEAAKSGGAGYPHTSVHESTTAAADAAGSDAAAAAAAARDPTSAAAAAAVDQEPAAVQAIEQESGGSAREAATAAVDQGLESPLQATAAAAGEGSTTGVVKGAAAAVAGAATGSSNSEATAAGAAAAAAKPPSTSGSQQDQQRVKRVLMGHSLGGACAALEYVFNPSEYAAVVLVDPAIIAGLRSNGSSKLEQLQDGTAFTRSLASGEFEQPEAAAAAAHEAAAVARVTRVSSSSSSEASSTDYDALAAESSSSSSGVGAKGRCGELPRSESLNAAAAAGDVAFYATRGDDAQFAALLRPNNGSKQNGNLLSTLLSRVLALVQTAAMLSTVLVLSVLRPVIVLLLRSLVRSRTFWANTLRQAYYDQSKVTPAAVDAYRMPQLVKGWETGMVQFLLARLGAGGTSSTTSAAAAVGSAPMGGLEDAGLAKRFAAAVAASNTPVLIVHGAGDKLVPASNSFKLARLVKGCRLAVVKRAGHCPQEEEPELFADIVTSFVARHTAVPSA